MKEMLFRHEFPGFPPDLLKNDYFSGGEPTSVLDTTRSPSPPASSSTSFGGEAWIGMTTVASISSAQQEADLQPILTSSDISGHGGFDHSFDFGIYRYFDESPFGVKFVNYGGFPELESFDFAVIGQGGRMGKPQISANPSISPLMSTTTLPETIVLHPELAMNQYQAQNAGIESLLSPPPPKRQSRGEQFIPGFPANLHSTRKTLGEDQAVIEQLYKAAEMLHAGNLVLAQGILARLNQQLSPVGRPFLRAAFYFKEALQLLLHINNNLYSPTRSSPFDLIFKIGAYKSFSEVSPVLQFANFTSIQSLLEALEGCDRIHILDFDIGYGCQWASLMQELAGRNCGGNHTSPSLKVTAFISSTAIDELEVRLTRENLFHFAREINIIFEFDIITIDSLNPLPFLVSDNEGVAVNLSMGGSSPFPLPLVLGFVKQFSPKIVVSLVRGSDMPDLSFPQNIVHSLQAHCTLLESLDAINGHLESLQKMEKFLLYPDIEKTVLGFYQFHEKSPPWRTVLLSTGFSPLPFSNFNESQAECLAKRSPVRGFHVEKRQSSLVLCWQKKELISISTWKC